MLLQIMTTTLHFVFSAVFPFILNIVNAGANELSSPIPKEVTTLSTNLTHDSSPSSGVGITVFKTVFALAVLWSVGITIYQTIRKIQKYRNGLLNELSQDFASRSTNTLDDPEAFCLRSTSTQSREPLDNLQTGMNPSQVHLTSTERHMSRESVSSQEGWINENSNVIELELMPLVNYKSVDNNQKEKLDSNECDIGVDYSESLYCTVDDLSFPLDRKEQSGSLRPDGHDSPSRIPGEGADLFGDTELDCSAIAGATAARTTTSAPSSQYSTIINSHASKGNNMPCTMGKLSSCCSTSDYDHLHRPEIENCFTSQSEASLELPCSSLERGMEGQDTDMSRLISPVETSPLSCLSRSEQIGEYFSIDMLFDSPGYELLNPLSSGN